MPPAAAPSAKTSNLWRRVDAPTTRPMIPPTTVPAEPSNVSKSVRGGILATASSIQRLWPGLGTVLGAVAFESCFRRRMTRLVGELQLGGNASPPPTSPVPVRGALSASAGSPLRGTSERDQRRVRNSLCQGHLVTGALEQGNADHDAVADDERREIARFDVG